MVTGPGFPRRGLFLGDAMPTDEEVTEAYLRGYQEARQRAQWTIAAAVDESTRLRNALEWALDEIQDPRLRARIMTAMHRPEEASE